MNKQYPPALLLIVSLFSINLLHAQNGIIGNVSDTLAREAPGSELIISSKNFNQGMILNPAELIIGKIPGLSISPLNGSPGSEYTISNLENSSLIFGLTPLIVVDNVPLTGTPLSINPDEIESFTFLRDGVSAGIYGGRAANGVLLIKTKEGGGRLKIDYRSTYSVSFLQNKVDVFSGDEFRQFISNVFADTPQAISSLGKSNTDWQDQISRTGYGTDQHLDLSGSVINIPFRLSFGKTIQQGIVKTSKFDRTATSLSISPKLFDNHLNIRMNVNGIFNNDRVAPESAVRNAILFDPTQSVYNSDGTYFQWNAYGFTPNPVAQLNVTNDQVKINRLIWNINVDYRVHFLPELRIIFNKGIDYMNNTDNNLTDARALFPFIYGSGQFTETGRKLNNSKTDLFLNYSKNLKSLSTVIGLTAGISEIKSEATQNLRQTSSLDPEILYQYSFSQGELRKMSEFGKLTVAIKNRYSFGFNLCNDRYSEYIDQKKSNLFPSFSFEWDIRNEPFMTDGNLFSGLRFYTGYGISTPFQPYEVPHGSIIAFSPQNFKLEKTTTLNAGLYFSILNNRIDGRINYSVKSGNDIWALYTLFSTSGPNQLIISPGGIRNNSIDFTLNASVISSGTLTWKIGYNILISNNKAFKVDQNFIYGYPYGMTYGDIFMLTNNYPVNSFFVYKQVYDQSGKPLEGQFVDLDGKNGSLYGYNGDKYHYHTSNPDALMDISSDLTFKNWDFAFSGRVSLGNYLFDSENAFSTIHRLYDVELKNASIQLNDTKFTTAYPLSDYFVSNASFFRMDFIRLGYRFKTTKERQPDISISAILQNAFVITAFKGQDPEVSSGISSYTYPKARTASLQVTFSF